MNEANLILGIDTATPRGGVCLLLGEDILASILSEPNISHSNTLLRDIEQVLKMSAISLQEIDLFAVAAGPGSFTGLRIGVATVKALSATLQRPCVGITSLQAIARAAGPSVATVALLPAGRGELFAQLLSVSDGGAVSELDSPVHLPAAPIVQKYAALPNIKWAGPGAQLHKELFREQAQSKGISFDDSGNEKWGWTVAKQEGNLAAEIARIARDREIEISDSAETLSALYVRPSDPELNACR
jgi:tRNA threonylcarbamoyladenosine biosynthesis protein TsaB